jgi:hypothetical protein
MDATTGEDLQRDEQWEATPEDAAGAAVDARVKDLHTSMPGIVKSFDATTQTATVQPAIQRLFLELGFVDLPPCVDVPVQFPRGGGFVLTFPVAAGDECLLVFGERAIDFWWKNGGVQLPSEYRLHDLSDAFAVMGFSSQPRVVTAFATNAAELRSLDGATVVRVESGQVTITAGTVNVGGAGGELAAKGETLQTFVNALITALIAHTHPVSGALAAASAAFAALSPPPTVTATKAKVL